MAPDKAKTLLRDLVDFRLDGTNEWFELWWNTPSKALNYQKPCEATDQSIEQMIHAVATGQPC